MKNITKKFEKYYKCFTTLENGFKLYNFNNGFENATYHWIAIK